MDDLSAPKEEDLDEESLEAYRSSSRDEADGGPVAFAVLSPWYRGKASVKNWGLFGVRSQPAMEVYVRRLRRLALLPYHPAQRALALELLHGVKKLFGKPDLRVPEAYAPAWFGAGVGAAVGAGAGAAVGAAVGAESEADVDNEGEAKGEEGEGEGEGEGMACGTAPAEFVKRLRQALNVAPCLPTLDRHRWARLHEVKCFAVDSENDGLAPIIPGTVVRFFWVLEARARMVHGCARRFGRGDRLLSMHPASRSLRCVQH